MVDIERVKLPVNEKKYDYLHDALVAWYVHAKPGEWYTYHTGYSLHENIAVEKVRASAWELACSGKIYLFLKRHPVDTHNFIWLCQKSTKPTFRLVPNRGKDE